MIIFSKGKKNLFSSPFSFPFSGRWRFVWNYPVIVTFSLSIDYTVQSWVVWTQVPNSISSYLLYSSLKDLCSNWVSEMHDIGNFQGKKIARKYSLPNSRVCCTLGKVLHLGLGQVQTACSCLLFYQKVLVSLSLLKRLNSNFFSSF